MRKAMLIIITIVAATTMRATNPTRPGYGASSSLRNSRTQIRGAGESRRVCATVAILNFHGRLQQPIRRSETTEERDSARGRGPDTATPGAPSSAFAARPEDLAAASQ